MSGSPEDQLAVAAIGIRQVADLLDKADARVGELKAERDRHREALERIIDLTTIKPGQTPRTENAGALSLGDIARQALRGEQDE